MPTVATDAGGDPHLLYMSGGQAIYRKVEVAR